MFKATPVLLKTLRRLPLSTKQAKKDYYKGNNVGNMGSIDQFGRFKVEWDKVRTYVYPEDGAKGEIFLSKELEEELREGRIVEQFNEPERTKYEPTKPEYTILFPDPKKPVGDEYLLRRKMEKVGLEASK